MEKGCYCNPKKTNNEPCDGCDEFHKECTCGNLAVELYENYEESKKEKYWE